MRNRSRVKFVVFGLGLWLTALARPASAAGVKVLFNPVSPEVGPFPTDVLTVSDLAQKTGLRVNLPRPDCQAEPSTCDEIAAVNQLDGFSIEPRLRVRFSGPINPDTLREGISLVWLDDLTDEEYGLQKFGAVTPINSVSYDPATNMAFAEPDEILSQHRRYALVVTNAVRDVNGDGVEPDPAFLACIGRQGGYCERLAGALGRVAIQLAPPRQLVGGSVFTTMSVTPWLEKARAVIRNSPIGFQRTGPKNIFAVADLSALVLKAQTGVDPPVFTDVRLTILPQLEGVDRIAFGSFRSPYFLDGGQVIPTVPTGLDVELPTVSKEVFFHVYLPGKPAPQAGYPVVIVGHSLLGNRFRDSTAVATAMATEGIAVIGVNAAGFGYGPETRLALTDRAGNTVEIAAGGRAVDLNRDGTYGSSEGCVLITPPNVFGYRDCSRQTALDIMQLVRAIKAGVDLDGDGVADLDRNRIAYAGLSQGAMFGAILMAVEPDIEAAVLTAGAGSLVDTFRWVKDGPSRVAAISAMSLRKPPLFNAGQRDYDYDWPLRYQPVRIIGVPGAVALQEYLERAEWIMMPGDALGYAPHLMSSTLPGVPIKRVLFQFGIGDLTLPNPCQTNLVRAANLRDTTSVYRHDLALAAAPDLPKDPHTLFYYPGTPAGEVIARAAQRQMAEFFASGGLRVPDVNHLVRPLFGKDLFGVPQFLPEELNY
jgi:hypothetical protein